MLRFYARDGHLQPLPNQSQTEIRRYYGRSPVVQKDSEGKRTGIWHKPGDEPFEVKAFSPEGLDLMRLAKLDRSVIPADAETAQRCNLTFVQPVQDPETREWDFPPKPPKPAAPVVTEPAGTGDETNSEAAAAGAAPTATGATEAPATSTGGTDVASDKPAPAKAPGKNSAGAK